MRNPLSLSDEDENESSKLPFCWWRSVEHFNDQGQLKLDLSNLSNLTPRVKVLREMERLALIAPEGLDDLRHKLITYRAGDFWLPTGGIKKEDMDIPPIVTILLVGFSGSGKSSLVNLMYSVLGRSGLIPFAQTSGNSSNYTTMFMEEHNVLRSLRSGFCVYDSRGLDYNRVEESLEGLSGWLVNGVHHHQLCFRSGDEASKPLVGSVPSSSSLSKFSWRKVNCVVVVANIAEIYQALKKGDAKPMEATKALFNCPAIRKCNENPILIFTHGDKLSSDERIDGRLKVSKFLGISETSGEYDVVCLTEHGLLPDESDPVTAYALTEAIYRALIQSDRSHPPKIRFKDWVVMLVTWLLCCIAAFFAFLADFFSKLGRKDKKLKL
ncbi:PREDICTED: uncharacterized protein LOC104605139 [Nelumbo nucifera]|uniref:Uncharacterized protein n=2 Tax=Nelumbo nucifera TaxID=4432 RepID=A0A822YL08_NELNU|nr:PREDICTED: uncharacterized protein LOC104605139 [Nelumbo nucifera]DAD33187.1 TPA_asm: hypothetical protein HUJ06_012038 [Nelumbo nucifera]